MPKLGILTGGGDSPGLNAVIRAAAKTAFRQGWEVTGFLQGYSGLVEERYVILDQSAISGLLHRGGTILGANNRDNPFHYPVRENERIVYRDLSDRALLNLERLGIQALITIGGDGTLAAASELAAKGARIVGVPKTIDNDLLATDQTFGFDTAVTVATEALDRLHTTAESHHRVMVLELMGRYAGWIALQSGVAGGADVILIPEIPWRIEKVAEKILERKAQGKPFSIVVVAEGAKTPEGTHVVRQWVEGSVEKARLGGIGEVVGRMIEEHTGIETRVTVLGHIQRGGSPTPFDRVLATRFGVLAAQLAMQGVYNVMVRLQGLEVGYVPLEEAVRGTRKVPPEGQLVQAARAIGISFGD
ncbi:MAG: ATP-dependent 6-phosphofructokinase [Clostridia bacterium]|nr:ATP-dependent 6-phosphofructokinase [Clostridia bacterium]MDH7572356.1 ATP-dependent 6-phosphofructokinase [Clostridia bacterium]